MNTRWSRPRWPRDAFSCRVRELAGGQVGRRALTWYAALGQLAGCGRGRRSCTCPMTGTGSRPGTGHDVLQLRARHGSPRAARVGPPPLVARSLHDRGE